MGAPRKFDQETRERAVRMYHDRLKENDGESKLGARRHVGALRGINPATLRNWIDADEATGSSTGAEPGSSVSAELKALRRENAELRRANEILKTASAFFAAAEVDRRLR
ncbi:hypothetical protein GCM10023353_36420 [Tomitella cavernea]|uniref:Transposase n=1 Tax=Tomitella cavernea TaxID=1387982 RepID=A0ABP9D7B1_9ACTN